MSQVQFLGSCSQDSGSQGRNFQVPDTHFQGPGCQDPCPRIPGLRVSEPQVPGSQVLGPGSQVLILDYAQPLCVLYLISVFKGCISEKKCQRNKSKFRYNRINFVQIAHNGASFIKKQGTLEKKVKGEFDTFVTITV